MTIAKVGLVTQSLFYTLAGINHFVHLRFYVNVMPDHYAHPQALVKLSGLAEIVGGVGLIVPLTRRAAAIGIAAMLIAFFDVHIYMLRHAGRFPQLPPWALWARIPIQFALIAWSLYYALPKSAGSLSPAPQRGLKSDL